MRYGLVLLVTLLILCSFSVCARIEVSISENLDFGVGDVVNFNYTLLSTEDTTIVYTPYVECPNAPQPIMAAETKSLKANVLYRGNYESIKLDNVNPQICEAFIEIHSPEVSENVKRTGADVKISTSPQVDFEIKVCTDSLCSFPSKVFVVGDNVFIMVYSDIGLLETSALLTQPDGAVRVVSFPFFFVPLIEGTYQLEVKAEKDGYRSKIKTSSFGVTRKHADISDASFSGVGVRESSLKALPSKTPSKVLIFSLVFIVIFIFGLFIVLILFKHQKKVKTLQALR